MGADATVDLGAVAQQDQQRDALDVVASGDVGRLVGVQLDHLQAPGQLDREPLHRRRDHPARPAPRRPEVEQDRDRGPHLLVERGGRRFDHPRQRVVAVPAARDALGARRDAVLAAAVRAADDGRGGGHGRLSAPGGGAAVARLAGVALADLDLAWLGLLGLGHADLEHAVVQARLGLDVAAQAGQRHHVLELADAPGATAQDALALALRDRAANRQLAFVDLDVHVLGARTGQLGLQDPGVVGLLDVDVGDPRAGDLGRRAHHLLQKLGGLLLDVLQLTERLVALRGLHALPVPPAVVASYEHGHGVLLLASLPVAPAPRPRRARAKPTRDEVLSRASGASPTAYLMR